MQAGGETDQESFNQQVAYNESKSTKGSATSNPVRQAVASQSRSLLSRKGQLTNSTATEAVEYDEGYAEEISPGAIVIGSSDGEIFDQGEMDESILVHDGSAEPYECESCGAVCESGSCSTCANHQTDSFAHWDATQAHGGDKIRFRPLSRLLGLVGLAVVEGERVEPLHGGFGPRSPYGQATGMKAMFGQLEPEGEYLNRRQ